MSAPRLRDLVAADLYRYAGTTGAGAFWSAWFHEPVFRYLALLRACQSFSGPLRTLVALWLGRVGRIYGISIPIQTRIGPGFYIGHYGGIVVNPETVIGRNCNISHGVTIGQTNRGARQGVPVIGDDVYMGPGSVIIGRIRIGNRVAIGANAVVTTDAEDDAVMAGSPARAVSSKGSEGYIQNRITSGTSAPAGREASVPVPRG